MKKALISLLLIVGLVIGQLGTYALAFTPVPDEVLYVVNNPNPKDRLNLRTGPDINAPSLCRYYNGARFEALSQPENGWIYVAVEGQETVKGYMQTKYLVYNPSTPVTSAIPLVAVNNKNGTGLKLRDEPNANSPSYGLVENGETVYVLGWGEQWCHVRFENITAFMQTSGLAFESTGTGSVAIPSGNWLNVNNTVPTDRLHLRTEPRGDATSLGKYYNGVSVEVLSYPSDSWAEVRIGNTVGYMQRKFLTTASVISAIPMLTVSNPISTDRLNLRAGMSDKTDSLGKYDNGTQVEVLGVGTTWHHVRVNGKTGYMLAKYLTSNSGTGSTGGNFSGAQAPSGTLTTGEFALNMYKAVLQHNASFIRAVDYQNTDLNQLLTSLPDTTMTITHFAVLDIDTDGFPEVILREVVGGSDYGVIVLHYQDESVYGYEFVYRALMQLKADGSFSFSSGASDNGIGTLSFDGRKHWVNNLNVSADTQSRKSDASWYEFTFEGVDIVLSSYRYGT